MPDPEEPRKDRRDAVEAVVGIWKDRDDLGSTEEYLRRLHSGTHRRDDYAASAPNNSAR
jgi:hypothetical protein